VLKLWTNSPADKAGLQIGDHLWSIGKATKDQQDKKDFEKVLQSSAQVTIFVASDSDWTKAQIAAGVGSNSIHPKLRKVVVNSL
jgi:C-terminal processing protease CtpA/Prc